MSQSILRARDALAILALAGAALGVQAQTQAQQPTPTTPSATPGTGAGAGAGANSSGTGTAAGQTSAASNNQGAVQAAFKRADSNGDGKLAVEELGVFPSLKMTDLDKNKDGFVSADEFNAGVTARTN